MTTSVSSAFLFAMLLLTASTPAATIGTVPVGNPGNAGDVQFLGTYGAVAYRYRIGQHEVTNAQYAEFLNGVDPTGVNTLALYHTRMSTDRVGGINFNAGAANGSKYETKSGRENNPVSWVTWYDSIRFANWMHNGMGAGDTENGAYTLLGGTPTPSNDNITRNPGAKWFLPSLDEWYKAAYHKNDGATGNYWDYPTSTDSVPYSDQPPGSDAPTQSNTANFFKDDDVANGYDDGFAVTGSTSVQSSQNYFTDVGAYNLSSSPYGTFDQGGNVWEWTETIVSTPLLAVRGGSYNYFPDTMHASYPGGDVVGAGPAVNARDFGFRLASIPEPAGITLCLAGGMILARRRGRK